MEMDIRYKEHVCKYKLSRPIFYTARHTQITHSSEERYVCWKISNSLAK